jgi:hypothetical protein
MAIINDSSQYPVVRREGKVASSRYPLARKNPQIT